MAKAITDELEDCSGVEKYWPPALVEWSTKAVRDTFHSSPELSRLLNPDSIKRTISVSFEVPIGSSQAQSKVDETRSGLKELALDENASLS